MNSIDGQYARSGGGTPARTYVGGDILFIEAQLSEGKGETEINQESQQRNERECQLLGIHMAAGQYKESRYKPGWTQ